MKFYYKSIAYSLLLHTLIALFLFVSPVQHKAKNFVEKKVNNSKARQVIKTTTVDALQVDREIERIKHVAQQKKIRQHKQRQAVLRQLKAATEQREKEELALKRLKSEQRVLREKQRRTAIKQRKKVLALKKARELERQKLLNSKKKRLALEKQMLLEQKRIDERKQLQAKEALEKKQKEEKEKAIALQIEREKQQQAVNAEINRHKTLLINAISQNWILPTNVDYSLSCRFEIKLDASGRVLKVTLLRTSGDPVLDRSAQTAIYNASPLPVPKTPEAFEVFKTVSLTVKPESIH